MLQPSSCTYFETGEVMSFLSIVLITLPSSLSFPTQQEHIAPVWKVVVDNKESKPLTGRVEDKTSSYARHEAEIQTHKVLLALCS